MSHGVPVYLPTYAGTKSYFLATEALVYVNNIQEQTGHLLGGPVGPASRWAETSNVKRLIP